MQSHAARRRRPETWDLIVVGAGFAGLAAAREAARRGSSVLVLDRLAGPGSRVATTGLLCPDSLRALAPPARFLGARLDALRLTGPALAEGARLERGGCGFTPTDTRALLGHLAEQAAAAGARLRWRQPVARIERGRGFQVVIAGLERLRARRVLGADGARSTVARSLGLAAPRDLLVGLERHFEPSRLGDLGTDEALLVLSGTWAPGYAVWALPGFGGRWQVGLLARPHRAFHAGRALEAACAALERGRGVRWGPCLELRAGWVPVGGASRRAATDDAALVGDAAGQVSELTAGGIGRASEAGAALGRRVHEGRKAWEEEQARAAARCGGARPALRSLLRLATRPGGDRLAAFLGSLPLLRPLLNELAFRRHPSAGAPAWSAQGL